MRNCINYTHSHSCRHIDGQHNAQIIPTIKNANEYQSFKLADRTGKKCEHINSLKNEISINAFGRTKKCDSFIDIIIMSNSCRLTDVTLFLVTF